MTTSTAELGTLTMAECEACLASTGVGRVAMMFDGELHVLPVNYAADGGAVVFRTADRSILTEVSLRQVAFEVDSFDERRRTGWSVTVHGYGRELTGAFDERSRRLQALVVDSWAPEGRDRWFEIVPDRITGRSLRQARR